MRIGNWKLEIGNWKLEIGNWELPISPQICSHCSLNIFILNNVLRYSSPGIVRK